MTLPGTNGGNLHSGANGVPNSGRLDPGLHSSGQDPGPASHPQHHVPARPVFYIHAPPPPPFLHYQWPMPFSYNPFTGFPGMGYGMVMPPFPPPPYMEAPAYILPHHPIQAVDYRRLLHPQVHAPSAPYQNPNQTRRVRPPHSVPVRETVNSEVQTEPMHRGVDAYGGVSPLASTDSGHGITSNSPSSSSSSQKRGSAEEDFQVNRTSTGTTDKQGFNIPHPTRMKTVQSCIGRTPETKSRNNSVGQENSAPCRKGHCNMWSVGSPDGMVPVCSSSQQEDEVVKERRISIPDILMSWGGGTPQPTKLKMADEALPENNHQLMSSETNLEHTKSVHQRPMETQSDPVVADSTDTNDDAEERILSSKDSETVIKMLKKPSALYELLSDSRGDDEPVELVGSVRHCLPYTDELLHSLNESQKLPDDEPKNGNETNPPEDAVEVFTSQRSFSSSQMKRKMNESVWSVESLAPFIPTKEWLLQNGMFEPEVIVELTEEAEDCRHSTQDDNLIVEARKRRQACMYSSPDSAPLSDSWLTFSTSAEKRSPQKKPEIEIEIYASEMRELKQSQGTAPSEKDPLTSPTCLQTKIVVSFPTAEGADEYRSSEPEANQSPNQESLSINENREKTPCSPEREETLPLSSAAGEKLSPTGHLIGQNEVDIEVEDGGCGNEEVSQLRNELLCVPMADPKLAEVSPSKGHLVDCGTQCTELQERLCFCEELKGNMGQNRRHPFKYPVKKANYGVAEICSMNGHTQRNQKRHGQWKNRGSEKHSSHQDAYNGSCGKPGKSKVGNARNPRY